MTDLKPSPFICLACGGSMWLMYRTPGSRLKCDDCGYECEQGGARRRYPMPPTDKEIIAAQRELMREAAKLFVGVIDHHGHDLSDQMDYDIINLIKRLEGGGEDD